MSTRPVEDASPEWTKRRVPVFKGQTDTNINTGEDYRTRTLADLFTMAPWSQPKEKGPAFIPSTHIDYDAREHKAQQVKGQFVALTGDIDKGNHTLEAVVEAVKAFAGDAAWLVYSSPHAREGDMRWRILAPLDEPQPFETWYDAQESFFAFMEARGFVMDHALARSGQPVYLPNVPAVHAKSGTALRGEDKAPLYYVTQSSGTQADGLSLDTGPVSQGIAAIRQQRALDQAERERIRAEAEKRRAAKPRGDGASIIEDFNASNSVATMLEICGYEQSPRHPEDWRSPHQTGETYATRIIGSKWVSLSESDTAAGVGEKCKSGCFGDAYDLFVHYKHGGNHKDAYRQLGQERRGDNVYPIRTPEVPSWMDEIPSLEEMPEQGPEGDDIDHGTPPDQTPEDLPDPVDLWARYDPAVLPKGLLPKVIEEYAFSQAELMGVDPGGVAMSALAVCSAVITDRICVQVKQHDPSWRESARLWVALIGPPSAKKTPIMSAATRPLNRIDSQLFAEYMHRMEAYEEDQNAKKADRQGIQKPLQRRLRISDATVEAAQEVMKGSPDGILSVQDELSGWFGAMDKYGSAKGAAGDRAFWLQAFNGGQYALNRVARGAALIPNLSISVLGGIQPEPLRKLVGETVDDGLVQRLLPVPLHRASVGVDAPRSGEVEAYEQLVFDMWQLNPFTTSGDAMRFDPEAQEIRRELEAQHHEMMSTEIISPKMASHFGKYDGIFARLCVLWHCIEAQGLPFAPAIISGATAARVAKFMDAYIAPNAVAFYVGMLGLADDHETLVELASYIVATKQDTVNSRVIQRAGKGLRSLTSEQARTLCEKLESMGWLIETELASRSNTPRWRVNPIVHERYLERSEKEQARREKAKNAIKDALAMSEKGSADD